MWLFFAYLSCSYVSIREIVTKCVIFTMSSVRKWALCDKILKKIAVNIISYQGYLN